MQLDNKSITISDVAELAGVSKTTVSRYLNGQTQLMSSDTAERIKLTISKLNYQPNNIARSLKSKRTNMVGVLISDISSPFSSAVILGIGDVLEKNGYTPLFVNTDDDPEKERRFLQSLSAKNVDGLIVNTAAMNNPHLIHISCKGMPVVLCDRKVKNHNFDIAQAENTSMMRLAVEHLKEQGYNRIAFFTQHWDHNCTRLERVHGFKAAMLDVFQEDASNDIYLVEADAVVPLEKFLGTLCSTDIPAIICVNSETTIRAYHAIQQKKLQMPGEIGLCGPDDWDWDAWMNWPLILGTSVTTMNICSRKIGELTARLLLEKINNPNAEPQHLELPAEMTIRQSTRRINPLEKG